MEKNDHQPKENLDMDINYIKKLLPHRYPFLLIDRIIECVPD